nr:GroEL, cpn60=60 kda chaperonin {N-terminal} [Pseudomonas acidovorans, ciprofloxacin-resistant, Peptide Partial, 15 aa] [Delftia acidovorans]
AAKDVVFGGEARARM